MKRSGHTLFSCLLIALLFAPERSLLGQVQRRASVAHLDDIVIRASPFAPAAWWGDSGIAVATDDQRVLLIGHDGQPRGSFGRKGRGPGEFEQLTGVGVVGDTVFAFDARTRRLTARLPDATVRVQSVSWPKNVDEPIEPLGLAAQSIVYSVRYSADPKTASEVTLIIRAAIDGSIIDTIGPMYIAGTSARVPFPGGSLTFAQPFANVDQLAIDSRSGWVALVHTTQSRFNRHASRLEVVARSGGRSSAYQVPSPLVLLTDPVVRRWLDESASRWASRFGGAAAARQALAAQLIRPQNHPSVRRALVGPDGALWLLQSQVEAPNARWSVLNLQGQVIATVNLPPESHVLVVAASGAWVLEESDDGEQLLVRYHITRDRR